MSTENPANPNSCFCDGLLYSAPMARLSSVRLSVSDVLWIRGKC